MGEILPNRLYLFLALKWDSPNFCVIIYLLFDGFFGDVQIEKQIHPINHELGVKNKYN